MTWTYNNYPLDVEQIPDTAIGFIYIITELSTGRKYLGRKLLTKSAFRMVKGKRKKYRKPSDFLEYWSSSPYLLELIEQAGKENFTREIICFADGKATLTYLEEKFQYVLGVLEDPQWINANIRSRIFKKHIMGKADVATAQILLARLTSGKP